MCISSYSKRLSRRIIYALFSQPVVTGVHPWRPLWDFSPETPNSPTPNSPTPGKNPAGAHDCQISGQHQTVATGDDNDDDDGDDDDDDDGDDDDDDDDDGGGGGGGVHYNSRGQFQNSHGSIEIMSHFIT